jgi:glycosyltransferase involved in cell wall biosynthesis
LKQYQWLGKALSKAARRLVLYSVSVVVPVYNEQENIKELHNEIKAVCEQQGYDYEIIFVDDGSTDSTFETARGLSPLKYIRFRRNFGQTAAMDAGIKAAAKDLIVTMDGDRQNDPADIPKMISFLEEEDLDVVSGWRKNRKDTALKKFTSRGANMLRGVIVKDNIHDSGCSLKVYKRECFENVNLMAKCTGLFPPCSR